MTITVGHRVPPARLAEISGGEISEIGTEDLFSGRRAVMIGVPGAFTPVCTDKHLPDFVAGADRLKRAGFDLIVLPGRQRSMDGRVMGGAGRSGAEDPLLVRRQPRVLA